MIFNFISSECNIHGEVPYDYTFLFFFFEISDAITNWLLNTFTNCRNWLEQSETLPFTLDNIPTVLTVADLLFANNKDTDAQIATMWNLEPSSSASQNAYFLTAHWLTQLLHLWQGSFNNSILSRIAISG